MVLKQLHLMLLLERDHARNSDVTAMISAIANAEMMIAFGLPTIRMAVL